MFELRFGAWNTSLGYHSKQIIDLRHIYELKNQFIVSCVYNSKINSLHLKQDDALAKQTLLNVL